jgi:hypothetical protein
LLAAVLYSCNVLPGAKGDNNNSTTIAGLAVLAASQRTTSGRAALVMPDCGKGFYTGETYADISRYVTLSQTGSLPGCNPISFSRTGGTSATMTYNSNRQLTTYVISGSTTTISYNSLNYIASSKATCTVASAGNSTVEYAYDSSGRISKITYTTPAGCSTSNSAAFSQIDDYTYSGGELFPATSVTSYNAGVCKTTYTYTNTKNSLGYVTTSVQNSSSTGSATVNNTNGFSACTPSSSSQTTSIYTFDSNGNIVSISQTGSSSSTLSATFTNTYDSSNRLLSAFSLTFIYNSVGQLTTSVSGSTTTNYSY